MCQYIYEICNTLITIWTVRWTNSHGIILYNIKHKCIKKSRNREKRKETWITIEEIEKETSTCLHHVHNYRKKKEERWTTIENKKRERICAIITHIIYKKQKKSKKIDEEIENKKRREITCEYHVYNYREIQEKIVIEIEKNICVYHIFNE
jgi:hypothetical protein